LIGCSPLLGHHTTNIKGPLIYQVQKQHKNKINKKPTKQIKKRYKQKSKKINTKKNSKKKTKTKINK
jgi:hypothetical protein